MISWVKTLKVKIDCFLASETSKRASKQLVIEYVPYSKLINNPMKIYIDKDHEIIVDAEMMKKACQKVLTIKSI
jgi:hypothetical protein